MGRFMSTVRKTLQKTVGSTLTLHFFSQAQKEEYLEKFSNETQALVDRASIITVRSMRAENFAIYIDILENSVRLV